MGDLGRGCGKVAGERGLERREWKKTKGETVSMGYRNYVMGQK